MIVDAQRMMAARMFEGPLEWSKARRVGGDPAPAGMFETHCLVPGLQGMCALVSKEWQQLFREWRDKEIEKRLRSMCRGLIYRALDMCDREQYSYRASVPDMSTLEDAFFVQGVKVVTLRFERTGKQKKHVLWTKVSRGLKLSLKRVDIPRHGWKSMLSISNAELEQWNVWADAQFKAQFAWIQGCL
jgi:hypothetical protein